MHGLKSILAEGMTKIVWDDGSGNVLIEAKDAVVAEDGVHALDGKAAYSTQTTVNCFRLLKAHAIPTHYLDRFNERTFRARQVDMIPLEVAIRRVAAGSYLQRRPDIVKGTIFPELIIEFYEEDGAEHDPLVIFDLAGLQLLRYNACQPLAQGFIDAAPLAQSRFAKIDRSIILLMTAVANNAFLNLEYAWLRQLVILIDLKLKFGFDIETRELLIADVIDNDSWQIQPRGDKNLRRDLDYHNPATLNGSSTRVRQLSETLANYAWAAKATDLFTHHI